MKIGRTVGRIGALGLGRGGEVIVGAEHVVGAEVEAAGAAARGGAGDGHRRSRVFPGRQVERLACVEEKGKGKREGEEGKGKEQRKQRD